MAFGNDALYDNGFYNIGVTPSEHDLGVGGKDPFGNPLSFAEQYVQTLLGFNVPDHFEVDPCTFEAPFDTFDCSMIPLDPQFEPVAVKGSFKTPSLRNISLTGPYFHNGSMATLAQVIEFYNSGGRFSNVEKDPDITQLGLSQQQKEDLEAFLLTLTDDRVRWERAPFDHPELRIPIGHNGNETVVMPSTLDPAMAAEQFMVLPKVGKNGRTVTQGPLLRFDQLLPAH
jgi:hypothetical protein